MRTSKKKVSILASDYINAVLHTALNIAVRKTEVYTLQESLFILLVKATKKIQKRTYINIFYLYFLLSFDFVSSCPNKYFTSCRKFYSYHKFFKITSRISKSTKISCQPRHMYFELNSKFQ